MSRTGASNSGLPTSRPLAGVTPVEILTDGRPAQHAAGPQATQIDELMERASQALVRMEYFESQDLCLRALAKCLRLRDWERLARAALPLQEARRQIRQLACDAGMLGNVFVLRSLPARGTPLEAGLYLLEPPLIGLDGRTFREFARTRKVPVLCLTKEPTISSGTNQGRWPIVGVGQGSFENVVARVQVAPPVGVTNSAQLPACDKQALVAWFMDTQEALGDAAIRKVRREWPPAHRVEDLLEYLDAVPDHEKLSQALESAARDAMTAPMPLAPRRRPFLDDPHSF